MPKNKFKKTDLQKAMMEKVGKSKLNEKGLYKKQVHDFIDEMMGVIAEKLAEGQSVVLPDIALLYPTIKPGKIVMNMRATKETSEGKAKKGSEAAKMYMPSRYVLKMKVNTTIKDTLMKTSPTQEEVDNLYRD